MTARRLPTNGHLARIATGAQITDAVQGSCGADSEPGGAGVVSEGTEDGNGAQVLILDGFPSVEQVRLLGPNSSTTNRFTLGRARQGVQALVKVEVGRQGIRPMAPPVLLTLRYVFGDARPRDVDNFAIVAKSAVDGLVKAGILAGDDAKRLGERVVFAVEKRARRLEIVLEHVEQEVLL